MVLSGRRAGEGLFLVFKVFTRAANILQTKEAKSESNRKWRIANPNYGKEYQRKWYAANAERLRPLYAAYVRNRPNKKPRTAAQARRGKGLPEPTRAEASVCECCGLKDEGRRLALDHDHISGAFRGWLCRACNLALGMLGDDIQLAIQRLQSYQQKITHLTT